MTGRDKEWIQVELTPELRKTGMVVRWYKDETRGWMHDSTVESIQPKPAAGATSRHDVGRLFRAASWRS